MGVPDRMNLNPVLSLITGTRNRPMDFRRLVDSIERHTPMEWELVVSDASDSPIEQEPVATDSTWPRIRVIPERPPLGCTAGYNRAFRQARGEWVLWLNDDCEVMPGYAENAIRFMEANREVGLGALYYADAGTGEGWHVNRCAFGMLYANFGVLKRELGNRIGWFDDDLKMYGNDNSLTYRVLLAGKGVAGIPEARIFHHSTRDRQRAVNNDYEFRHQQADLLKAKYGPHLAEMRAIYERTRLVTA
jgi:GT2 family glycosyltransferase